MKKNSDVHQIISKNHSCNERGITLVALIVTIIVLLILSGITIASFKSNIITRARSSAKRYSASQIDEKIDVSQQSLVAEREGYDYSIKDLVDEVKKENKDIDTIFVDESNNGRKATYIIDDYFYDFTKKDDGIIVYNRKADASDKDKEKYKNKNELRGLKSGIITFKNDKTDWTNENVNVTIVAKAEDKSIQEKIETKLTTLTKKITSQVATNQGDTIYACLTDGYGTYVAIATEKIDNIDKTAPTNAVPTLISATTSSITVQCNQVDEESGIKYYYYSCDGGENWSDAQRGNQYTFNNLFSGTSYNIKTKAIDNGENGNISGVASLKTIGEYYVSFNGNGATSGSMPTQTFTKDVEQKLASNAYTASGYSFMGWTTTSNSHSAIYSNGQSVKNIADPGSTVTLYAIWYCSGGYSTSNTSNCYNCNGSGQISYSTISGYSHTYGGWTCNNRTLCRRPDIHFNGTN